MFKSFRNPRPAALVVLGRVSRLTCANSTGSLPEMSNPLRFRA